jgi:hypothetical protein
VTGDRRKQIAIAVFVVNVLTCGIWAYWAIAEPIRLLSQTGSGGIAAVSSGLLDVTFTVVPPIVTIVLARASGSTPVARHWRNAHLVVTLALIIVPMMARLRVLILSIALFIPVQVFFVVGAIAIWFASPRRQPSPSQS